MPKQVSTPKRCTARTSAVLSGNGDPMFHVKRTRGGESADHAAGHPYGTLEDQFSAGCLGGRALDGSPGHR